jgi:predicted nucleic acid-binding Zn ribbon protein
MIDSATSKNPPAASHVARNRDSAASQPQPLGDLMSRFLTRSGLAPKVEAAGAVLEWAGVVGPQIAAVTEALRVSEGALIVAVANSAWMNELNMMRAELMRRINAGRKEGRIRTLVFVMGENIQPVARP